MLEIKVHEIRGKCPVYKVGDKIVVDDPKIILDRTDALCSHALSTLLHYVTILEHDWCPVELGLTTPEDPDHAYMQCVDPGQPYTNGGTVIFECCRINTIVNCVNHHNLPSPGGRELKGGGIHPHLTSPFKGEEVM